MVAVSGVSAIDRAMPDTAWKTTATAAARSPAIQPPSTPTVPRRSPKAARMIAEGAVNISHAAAMPAHPARW